MNTTLTIPGQLIPRSEAPEVGAYLAQRYPWADPADYPTLFPGWCYLDSMRPGWHHRLFVPIFKPGGELWSYVARDLRAEATARPRYLSGPNAGKDGVIYQPDPETRSRRPVWLVEGVFDTPPIVQIGDGVIATLGSTLHSAQIQEMQNRLAPRTPLVIAWDKDKLGAAWQVLYTLSTLGYPTKLVTGKIPDNKDIGDLTPDEVRALK